MGRPERDGLLIRAIDAAEATIALGIVRGVEELDAEVTFSAAE